MLPPTLDTVDIVKGSLLIGIAIFSYFGNSATLAVIYRMKGPFTRVRTLISNLAVADLFVTTFCMVVDSAWIFTVAWNAGNVSCKLLKYLQVFSMYASTYVLVLLSIDRCMAVVFPMSIMMTPLRLNLLLAFVWVISGVLALPEVCRTLVSFLLPLVGLYCSTRIFVIRGPYYILYMLSVCSGSLGLTKNEK